MTPYMLPIQLPVPASKSQVMHQMRHGDCSPKSRMHQICEVSPGINLIIQYWGIGSAESVGKLNFISINGKQFMPTDFDYEEIDIDKGEDEEEESGIIVVEW